MTTASPSSTQITLQPISVAAAKTNGKGPGKIILRSSHSKAQYNLELSLNPGQKSDEDELSPRFPAWLSEGNVQAFDVRQPQALYKAWDVFRSSKPACLLHTTLIAPLVSKWTPEYLSGAFGGLQKVDVLCAEERSSAYLHHDSEKNIYGSFYHVREPKTRRLPMTVPEFVGCLTSWSSKKLLLKADVMHGADGGVMVEPEKDLGQQLRSDLQTAVDWQWLKDAQQVYKWGSVSSVSLEMGSCNGLQPARYHCRDRLLAQVSGRRRILLIAPDHAHHGMYPFAWHHTYDGYAMPDLDRPDREAWPKLGTVRGLSLVLQPGQLLFIPAYWFAHVQDMDKAATTLVFSFSMGLRLQSKAALGLAVSRLIEERVGLAEGMADVRKWLLIIGYDDEENWLDIGTVKGYKRVVMCQEVREEIRTVLGEQTCIKDFLLAMCDDRLQPTPWLNKDFREPLYLTDKVLQLPDTRSDEDLRYPELFRHRIEAAH